MRKEGEEGSISGGCGGSGKWIEGGGGSAASSVDVALAWEEGSGDWSRLVGFPVVVVVVAGSS